MASGLLGASMAQPIDDCLKTLGAIMVAGPKSGAVMSSSWQPLDLLGKSGGGEAKVQDLVSFSTLCLCNGLC